MEADPVPNKGELPDHWLAIDLRVRIRHLCDAVDSWNRQENKKTIPCVVPLIYYS